MTRINADLDPRTLKRAHLLAELREITMVPASLKRSLRTKTTTEVLRSIPKDYSLGKGHVTHFYNKLLFLQKRFNRLADEMERRGYNPDRTRIIAFDGFDIIWYGDWTATDRDNDIVRVRIEQRIAQKPHLYKDQL
jgi:deoxyribonuclease (pyrimidine dimer)